MLIEQSPSVDGCVDTRAKILAEASIFRPFDTQLLSTPVLDFLAKVIKILDSGEVTASFGLWLVVHGGKKGREHKEGILEKLAAGMLAGGVFVVSAADVLLTRRGSRGDGRRTTEAS
jgi:hypothetical protein